MLVACQRSSGLVDEPGSKISRSCRAARWSGERFDVIAETSQFADHLARTHFLRLCADGRSAFLVPHALVCAASTTLAGRFNCRRALVQDLPDQSTESVGDGPNR